VLHVVEEGDVVVVGELAPRRLPAVVRAVSVIIPAFNEEHYVPRTLEHLGRARDHVGADRNAPVEVIVVDNASTDRTAEIAMDRGACVVLETDHNIARVRNTGASGASGDLLVFIEADTLVPNCLLSRIIEVMEEPTCLGGVTDRRHARERQRRADRARSMSRWIAPASTPSGRGRSTSCLKSSRSASNRATPLRSAASRKPAYVRPASRAAGVRYDALRRDDFKT
jgi:glycosyltransferase involved in cell wall biosynthesis